MPTDLQIIDAMEGLRSGFAAANPNVMLGAGRKTAPTEATSRHRADEVLEAWLRATLGFEESTGAQRRWIRELIRLGNQESAAKGATQDKEVQQLLKKHGWLLRDLREAARRIEDHHAGREHVVLRGSFPTAASEAAAWEKLLPRLGGIKAWRFLNHLGRSVLLPEPPVRRFLWRVGLLDRERAASGADYSKAASTLERIQQLIGMPPGELEHLLIWHTSPVKGEDGGNRCGRKPRCEGCAFAPGCLFARYQRPDLGDDEGQEEQPGLTALQKKFDNAGAADLTDAELIAVVLQAGGEKGAAATAESLLRRFGGLKGIDKSSAAEIKGLKGVGEGRARQLKAAFELGRRLAAIPLERGAGITGSEDVWNAFRHRYSHISQEHFIVLFLDTKNRLIQSHLVSRGSLTGSLAHPREVFKEAVRHSASGVILMHNHPSGDPAPSPEDFELTDRLVRSGNVLGIRVLDHIILGAETYYSFKDEEKI